MKIRTDSTSTPFHPVTLAITFESVEELKDMFNRMNRTTPPDSSTFGVVKDTGLATAVFEWVRKRLQILEVIA